MMALAGQVVAALVWMTLGAMVGMIALAVAIECRDCKRNNGGEQ